MTTNPFRNRSSVLPLIAAVLISLTLATNSPAASLLLDFGPTTATDTDVTLSMGHFAGAVPANETSWNTITGDKASDLVYSDGSSAAGVSVDLGRSGFGVSDAVDFGINVFTSSALGGQLKNGIYTNTSPLKDGVFASGTTSANTNILGIRVDGLAAGTYTLYISGRNTSTAVSSPARFFCATGPSANSFSFSTNATAFVDELNSGTPPGGGIPSQNDVVTGTFAYGDNCVHLVATINEGDALFFAVTGNATNEMRGFLNALEIVPGAPVLTNFPATVGVQPAGHSVYEGATVSINNVKYGGVPPLFYQWYLNGELIPNATNTAITISNATAAASGNYSVQVSNSVAFNLSSNALITVVPLFNTGQASNIWNLLPGDRFYVTVSGTSGERGMAYNPVTTNLLLVSQVPSNNVVVLDAATGAEKYFLQLGDIGQAPAAINVIGVADDGVVYGANVTANAGSSSTPFNLWQWANDDASTVPVQVLSGDPGFALPDTSGLRWGDVIAVRGAGTETQILLAPGSGTNICLLTTSDGFGFFPTILTISGVPSGFARFGIAFGPGENTFWAKTRNQPLYLIHYDLNSGLGEVVQTYTNLPDTFRFISTDKDQKWMAGVMSVASGLSDNVRLYDISDLAAGPVLKDQELYDTQNGNNFLNGAGTGATAIGDNFVFALDSQNGIKAFLIDPNFTPSLDAFQITSVRPQAGSNLVLTWESVPSHVYQVQSKTALTDPIWSDVGEPITAIDVTTSITNSISGASRFYRVRGL
ncbi:MAG TPA: immunoglobulin domain-containing protein [Verrucomicrobiae bacterium]